ncbi:hypothetical protein Egran_05972 [Elaphomyces granulatus]|uniref:CHY-type domain-containing protein n=1 Tax=Elaphomyces granulatus TaxID=519963 RepID=A0A232LQ06_9EURO|nr:hypothetical protein Egran_05972 [Elaphomyces granulatus]
MVPRPISTVEKDDPRDFQISQLRRRFHPTEQNDDSGTLLTFTMTPTDPDFPFDLAALQCALRIPPSFPSQGRPTLRITNPGMERGFQINVEKGFDKLVDSSLRNGRPGTLLGWMNALDRQLEALLTLEKAPTLKFIANTGSKEEPEHSSRRTDVQSQTVGSSASSPRPVMPITVRHLSREEISQAEKIRKDETKQLEARLSRLPLFQKSSDGLSYVVPVEPDKVDRLPLPLRFVKMLRLVVPRQYPLDKSSIELLGVERIAARTIEASFDNWARQVSYVTLMSQINYIVQNMHIIANSLVDEKSDSLSEASTETADPRSGSPQTQLGNIGHEVPSHIQIIPRPPEWSVQDMETHSGSSDEYDEAEDYPSDDEEGGAMISDVPSVAPAKGTSISLPSLEIYGIELLELKLLSATLKCQRCKELLDVKNVMPNNDPNSVSPIKVESCKKCASHLSVAFRREFIHSASNRAGYLDLEGCTVVDLLPRYVSQCNNPFGDTAFHSVFLAFAACPGIQNSLIEGVGSIGNSFPTVTLCRHALNAQRRFPRRVSLPFVDRVQPQRVVNAITEWIISIAETQLFKISEVKFLVVGPSTSTLLPARPRRKTKETLGLVVGQELPRRGRCVHYGKSYRWFRFSCCAKVFPCDKCHDVATDHPNEHANRMICGVCSREQIYRPEDCGVCHSVLVGKAGSGFWEGGKGTRDKVRMSRKDPRKYKRRGGSMPVAASASKRK